MVSEGLAGIFSNPYLKNIISGAMGSNQSNSGGFGQTPISFGMQQNTTQANNPIENIPTQSQPNTPIFGDNTALNNVANVAMGANSSQPAQTNNPIENILAPMQSATQPQTAKQPSEESRSWYNTELGRGALSGLGTALAVALSGGNFGQALGYGTMGAGHAATTYRNNLDKQRQLQLKEQTEERRNFESDRNFGLSRDQFDYQRQHNQDLMGLQREKLANSSTNLSPYEKTLQQEQAKLDINAPERDRMKNNVRDALLDISSLADDKSIDRTTYLKPEWARSDAERKAISRLSANISAIGELGVARAKASGQSGINTPAEYFRSIGLPESPTHLELSGALPILHRNFGIELPEESAPAQTQAPQQYNDGMTATNPQTGQKMIYRGGQWQAM